MKRTAVRGLAWVGQGDPRVIDVLLQALRDDNNDIQRMAAFSLGWVGKGEQRVVEALLQASFDDYFVPNTVDEALERIVADDKRMVEVLFQALRDGNRRMRERAVRVLTEIDVDRAQAIEALLGVLANEDDVEVRRHVIRELGQVGVGNEQVVEVLLQALHDEDATVLESVVNGLQQIGVDNTRIIEALLKRWDYWEAEEDTKRGFEVLLWQLEDQLEQGDARLVKVLLDVLGDEKRQWVVRESAERILLRRALQDGWGDYKWLTDELVAWLNEREARIQATTVHTSVQAGLDPQRVVDPVLRALKDEDILVRRLATYALGRVGQGDVQAIMALLRARWDEDEDVSIVARHSLWQLEQGGIQVVDELIACLGDADAKLRWAAAEILSRVESAVANTDDVRQRVIETLLQLIDAMTIDVRLQVVGTLLQLIDATAIDARLRVVEMLLQLLADKEPKVREAIAQKLGEMYAEKRFLDDPDTRFPSGELIVVATWFSSSLVQEVVNSELYRTDKDNLRRVVQALLRKLHDEDEKVKCAAVEALGRVALSEEQVIDALAARLEDEEEQDVRKKLVEVLGQVGQNETRVIDALLQLLTDEEEEKDVRLMVVEALGDVKQSETRVIDALVTRLDDNTKEVQLAAAKTLGQFTIEDSAQLRRVLIGLNHCLYDEDNDVHRAALASIRQLLDGRPIPGYRWVSLREQRLRYVFGVSIVVVVVLIILGLIFKSIALTLLATILGIIHLIAAVSQLSGWTLRDLLEYMHKKRKAASL